MYRLLILLLCQLYLPLSVLAACNDCHATTIKINEVAVEKAKTYLHVRELKNDNRSLEIDKFHKLYGLPYGNPWCMMFVGNAYYEAFTQYKMKSPVARLARVSGFSQYASKRPLDFKTISTKKLVWGAEDIEQGDMISFKHGLLTPTDNFTWDGHEAMGIKRAGNNISTIEGNTKPSAKGDQTGRTKGDLSAGLDGVYMRERQLGLGTKFPIAYIIRLNKREFNQ